MPDRARRLILALAAVAVVVIVVIVVIVVAVSNGDDGRADPGPAETSRSDTDGSTEDAADQTVTTSGDAGTTPPIGPSTTTTVLPPALLEPVSGVDEAALCRAVVERLGEYRDVATDLAPDRFLLEALDEFEAQIDTLSDDQDWGDRIIEDLTTVRREWVTALSAESSGDDAEAERRNDAALTSLGEAIDDAACPTG
jgi:hypothetical protein